ncbi:MAG: alternative ribosome rescue aminoacyl-tRNA hydrolase ArfB [Deltaproteobacteria bacterium]
MIRITPRISLDESEIRMDFVRSSGPGGQNVNKLATAAQLRFDIKNSPNLPDDVRERLIQIAGNKVTRSGVLIIEASRFRTQETNRNDAVNRLTELIRRAAKKPALRRKTRPTLKSQRQRLETKRQKGKVKELRKSVKQTEE